MTMWQEELALLCRARDVPAAVVAVGGEEASAEAVAYGVCDLGSGVAVRRSTAFGVASVSKSITAVAIMQLVDRGLVALDDRVSAHIPEVRGLPFVHGADVRVRHLLSHTGGLPSLPTRFRVLSAGGDPRAPRQPSWVPRGPSRISSPDHLFDYWRSLGEVSALGAPGEVFSYSNEGYVLLGMIVERLTGRRLAEVVRSRVFAPLGMTRSAYRRSSYVGAGSWAVYHVPSGDASGAEPVVRAPARYYEPLWHSAGGVFTTVDDLLRYLRIFRTRPGRDQAAEGVLSPEGLRRMLEPATDSTLPGIAYGAGLWLGEVDGERYVYHGGSGKGISAYVGVFPETGSSCAVVSNVSGAPVEQLAGIAMRGRHARDISAVHAVWRESDASAGKGIPAQARGLYRSGEGGSVLIDEGVVVAGERVDVLSATESGIVVRGGRGAEFVGYADGFGPGGAVTFGGRVLRRAGLSPA